jgi:predicted nucleic acid-binding protein
LSLLFDHLPPGTLVLDASAIINLLGCGEMPRVLQALGALCVVEERTLGEVLRHPVPGQDHGPVLDGLRRLGALKVERMTAPEYEIYLSLVQGSVTSRLGNGESAAIALASRGYMVILDDNKARSVVSREYPSTRFCSTLRLLLTAGKRGSWPIAQVQRLVLSARRHARMGVPRMERDDLSKLMDGVAGWPVT